MKKQNSALRKTIGFILVVLTLISAITGCSQQEKGLEGGFYKQNGEGLQCPSHALTCAYRSDRTEFDIDDVTITFYYGGTWGGDIESISGAFDYPSFSLVFRNDESQYYLIREVNENLVSEKYRHIMHYDRQDDGSYLVSESYNHSEEITIPKELFTKTTGCIDFCVFSQNIADPFFTTIGEECRVHIYYKQIKSQGKVILSDKKF